MVGLCCEEETSYCCPNKGPIPYRCCSDDKPICCEYGKCCDTADCCNNSTIIDYELERLIELYTQKGWLNSQ